MPVSFFVGVVIAALLLTAWVTSAIISFRARRHQGRWGSQLSATDDAAARAARAGGGNGAGSAMASHGPGSATGF